MAVLYRHHGVCLVRSTTDPGDLDVPRDLDPGDRETSGTDGQAWLDRTWARADVRDAVTLASPDLAARITGLLARPGHASPRDVRRTITSLSSYLLRWQRRVTPFGLFAGVIPSGTGPAAAALGPGYRAVARPSPEWTDGLTMALGRDPALRERLTVTANALRTVRDGRLVLQRREAPGARTLEPERDASVRWSRPVQAAMELAVSPLPLGTLADELQARFPSAPDDMIRGLLDGLIDEGFLTTGIQPPMTAEDQLQFLHDALHDAQRGPGTEQDQKTTATLRELAAIRAMLDEHNTCTEPADAAVIRAAASERMATLTPCEGPPLEVDVRLSGSVTLPAAVLEEAAAAAGVLLRLTTRPFGTASWMEYQAKFKQRYGPGTLVPVTDLVADSGLGFPDGYPGAPAPRPAWRTLTQRDAALLTLIQQAALDGRDEISLTRADIETLTTGDHETVVPPPRCEITFALHARSAADLDSGKFELRVAAAARFPGTMAGRFLHLLTPAERAMFTTALRAGEEPGVLPLHLSFPPRLPRAGHMTRVAPDGEAVLHLGEHPGTGPTVNIGDLAVTADAAQLYLVHLPTGRRVAPRIPHALEMTSHTPPLARFIAEVAGARCADLRPFDFGAARVLPYVPRIRYRRAILSPARWHLDRAALDPGPGRETSRDGRLSAWRQAWHVPDRVVLHDGEQRLPLDLGSARDRQILHARLDRKPAVDLREDSPDGADGWLGRPAEILVPLSLASPAERPLPATAPPGRTHRPGTGTVVCAQIAGNPDRFGDLTARHLPRLAESLAEITEHWWIRRHRDLIRPWSPQHIAIYLRLTSPDAFTDAAAGLSAFADSTEAHGLPCQVTLAPYHEHPGRYGQNEALTAAEHVFAADTAAAVAQLTTADTAGIPVQALAAASMTHLAAGLAAAPADGYRALTRCLEQGSGPLDRSTRDLACRLADPSDDLKHLRTLPGGDTAADAWHQRGTALAAYRDVLAGQRDPGTVLRTLLHEHHMRAVGLDPDTETQTGRLARAAALQRLALDRHP